MKKVFLLLVVVIVFIAAVFLRWGGRHESADNEGRITGKDVTREAKEAVQTTLRYTVQEKDDYMRNMEQELRDMDVSMGELKEKAARLGGEARRELDEKIEVLKEKRAAAAEKLEKMKAASGRAWEDLKEDADESVRDLKDTFARILSRFRE